MYTQDEKAVLWLCACTGFDYRERVALLRAVRIPSRLFTVGKEFFAQVIKTRENGLYKEDNDRCAQVERFLANEEKKGRFCVTLASDDYPESLRHISDPPLVLYGVGNRKLLGTRKFTVVGSRITPPWAAAVGKRIAGEIAERFTVVTGIAEGGDCAAISGALGSGNLICVLANGLDECYPAAHADLKDKIGKKGLLLTECLPQEKVKKYSFHARNRLLAGLSEGVLVLSAGARSGTLITANCALEYGKDVFALPHNAGVRQGEGCNALIKAGAYLTTDTQDIFSVYGIEKKEKSKIPLTEAEELIVNALRADGEMHVALLAQKTNLRIFEVTATLTALEMKGLVVSAGGNKYALI